MNEPWHADDEMLDGYVAGRATMVVDNSVEQHLIRCADCRARLAPLVDPVPLQAVWQELERSVLDPEPSLGERLLTRTGLPPSDALLVCTAPALRASWLLGSLLTLAFVTVAAAVSDTRGLLLFLMVAPMVPVVGVALAYDADEDDEPALAAPYSAVRLLLLRTLAVLLTSLPFAVVGGLVLGGPSATAVAWLAPALGSVAVIIAASTWVSISRAATGVALSWCGLALLVSGPAQSMPLRAVSGQLNLLYLALGAVAVVVFWRRADRLSMVKGRA